MEGVELVRARWVGHRIYSEIQVRVPDDLSVAETSRIKEELFSAAKRNARGWNGSWSRPCRGSSGARRKPAYPAFSEEALEEGAHH